MNNQITTRDADAVLREFLQVKEDREAERLLSTLISEYAGPIIKAIIKRKLFISASGSGSHHEDLEDTYNDVVVQLLKRLQSSRDGSNEDPINDFSGYVAVAAYNTCHRELRTKSPERWRLKNRIRYLVTHQTGLALWRSDMGETLCGLSRWNFENKPKCSSSSLAPFYEDPRILEKRKHSSLISAKTNLRELVAIIFQSVAQPVEIDDLVTLVAKIQGIEEPRVKSISAENDLPNERELTVGDFRNHLEGIEQQQYLKRLWDEIVQLPLRQRVALLLNLKDENEGVLSLLPTMGIASIRELAAIVEMNAEKFAGLWNLLPLEDSAIAIQMGEGVTRQQVINLRKAARARLARRMAQWEKESVAKQ